LNFERDGLSMALGSDGNVYAFSGSGSNPTGLTNWEMLGTDGGWGCPGTCPQMNSGHVFGAAVAVGTKIYVMGGVAEPADQTSNNTVEYIDVTNLAAGWQEVAGMFDRESLFRRGGHPRGHHPRLRRSRRPAQQLHNRECRRVLAVEQHLAVSSPTRCNGRA
jgi:hypothetical protein